MNQEKSFHSLIAGLGLVALVCVSALAWLQMLEARDAYTDGVLHLQDCEALAEEIEQLRTSASIATTVDDERLRSNESLRQLLGEAGIEEKAHFVGVERIPPQPISGTEYLRDDAIVKLRGVSLAEVCRLLVAVSQADSGWKSTSLQLNASNTTKRRSTAASTEEELWDVNLGLTHLVYVAKSS